MDDSVEVFVDGANSNDPTWTTNQLGGQFVITANNAYREMEGPFSLALFWRGIQPVIEANRADGKIVTQSTANRVTHALQSKIGGALYDISGVCK